MYTGGTTGRAKGVLLDQRAEMLNFYHIGLAVDFGEDRVYLHQTPMFHAASMGGILGIPATGGSSVFVPLFEPDPGDGSHRALSRRLDGDGADDDRARDEPPRLPARATRLAPRSRLRRITDAGGAARAGDDDVARSQPVAGLRHDRVLVGAHVPHCGRPSPRRPDPAFRRSADDRRQPQRAPQGRHGCRTQARTARSAPVAATSCASTGSSPS